MQKNKKLIDFISIILTIGVIFFAFVYGKQLIAQADFSGLSKKWWAVAASFGMFAVFYAMIAWHWLRVCRSVVEDSGKYQYLSFFASQPYKYLPSSIFTFSFRAKYAKELGLSVKKSSVAQLIENFNLLGGGLATALLAYIAYYSPVLGVALLLAATYASYTLIRHNFTFRLPKTGQKISTEQLLPNFLLMMFAWVVSGSAFALLGVALGKDVNLLLAISANAAAYVASILAVFAPGGIGVREVILVWFNISNAVVVLWRLLTFAADIFLGFVAIAIIRRLKKAKPNLVG